MGHFADSEQNAFCAIHCEATSVDADGADNKTDSTGVVDVAIVMIDDVAIGNIDAVIIVAKNWKCDVKRNEPS